MARAVGGVLHTEHEGAPLATARTAPVQGRGDRAYLVFVAEIKCCRRDPVGLGCR